jgi:type II secretory pathway pseudopilin PulG
MKRNNKINLKNNQLRNKKSGITLIALVITIIIMLILVAVTVTVSINGGLITSAKDSVFKEDIQKYKQELEEYKTLHTKEALAGIKVSNNINTEDNTETQYQQDMKKYISSIDFTKYKTVFYIYESELYYDGTSKDSTEHETDLAEQSGIKVKTQNSHITIKIEGNGTVTLKEINGKSFGQSIKEGETFEADYKTNKTTIKLDAIPGTQTTEGRRSKIYIKRIL